jgi:hypothetical protein
MRAYEALMDAGRRATLAVGRVAVHREELAPQDVVYLVGGLRAGAAFRLDRPGRAGAFVSCRLSLLRSTAIDGLDFRLQNYNPQSIFVER